MVTVDIHSHVPADNTLLSVSPFEEIPEGYDGPVSMGLHPWYLEEEWEEQFRTLSERVRTESRVAAIGECGIDPLRGPLLEVQRAALERQVMLSEELGLPMVLHVVRRFDIVIAVRKSTAARRRWLVHGFRGGESMRQQLMAQGIDVSFGERFNASAMASVPADRLFLETDGRVHIYKVVEAAARTRGCAPEEIWRDVSENNALFLQG